MKDEEVIVTEEAVAEETVAEETVAEEAVAEETVAEITVAVVSSWDAEEIVSLYRAAGWWDEASDSAAVIPAIFSGSFAVAVAFTVGAVDGGDGAVYDTDKRAVGMGRVLSDGVSDAYIQDVVVDPACRGRGIGKRIIRELVMACQRAGISWIALVAEPGTQTFYEPLGFTVMEDYTPMKYAGDGKNTEDTDMNYTGDTK